MTTSRGDFRQGLCDAFTDDVRAAWTDTYSLFATLMKSAAAEVSF